MKNAMECLKKDEIRVLQVNLDDAGGAFSLMFQVQKHLNKQVVFDYYSMANFRKKAIVDQIENMGGKICEARLRSNRLIGHIILPFDFYKFLKKNEYKIIHIHADTAWKLLLYSIPAKIVNTKNIIVHAHSSSVNGDFRWAKYLCHYVAKPLLPKFAMKLITCSDKAALWMFPMKTQKKVIKIHNGVELEKYAYNYNARKHIRDKLNIKDDELLLGAVGDFSYSKNPFFIVDVLNILLNKNKDQPSKKYWLIFVGEGDERKKVENYARKKRVYERIIFYGRTNNIAEIYSSMDIFIMPSKFEGLPVSAIEAQVNGLSCLFSNRITREIKCRENCSFLDTKSINEWVEKIEQYIPNSNRTMAWEEVGNLGFSIECSAREMLCIYEGV